MKRAEKGAAGRRAAGMAESLKTKTMNRIMKRAYYVLAAVVLWPWISEARIKLVALPERARVVVALTHPDATLVEEERVVTLQKGVNHMDFSWRGVNIDPSTIQLRLLSHPDQIGFKSITTSYPPNENALVWEISSPQALEERRAHLLSALRPHPRGRL